MQTFAAIFQPYFEAGQLPEPVAAAELLSLEIDRQDRVLHIQAAFPDYVERSLLFALEEKLAAPLQARRVQIRPRFPREGFSPACYPGLVQELKRRDASLNGSLKDSTARVEDGKLLVCLQHGAAELLRSRHVDRALSRLVEEEFGLSYPVAFEGKTDIDSKAPEYEERRQHEEEKARRAAVVEEVERYEASVAPKKAKEAEIHVRSGETLLPSILPVTARDLYGRSG